MSDKNIVYLIGFMGSGKTTAGRKLASVLGWNFIDLDKKIEEVTGSTVPDIFSKYGEEHFRSVETLILKSINSINGTVLSAGGGTPCFEDNMDYMLQNGITVYLRMTPQQLAARLASAREERPLLRGLTREDLPGFIEEKLSFREKWYNRADIVFDGFSPDINSLQKLVKEKLKI